MSCRLKRFGGKFKHRMTKQREYEWRQRHPKVKDIIAKVQSPMRKKTPESNELTLAQVNKDKKMCEKQEWRSSVLDVMVRKYVLKMEKASEDNIPDEVRLGDTGDDTI